MSSLFPASLIPAPLALLLVIAACSGDPSTGRQIRPSTPVTGRPIDAGNPIVDQTQDAMAPVTPPGTPVDAGCTECREANVGVGGDGFDLAANPGESIALDDDGALIVSHEAVIGDSFIWVSDTGALTPGVSKIDTRTRREVARYAVVAADPSRTSVSLGGDAYVSSRAGMAVTKVSGAGADCADNNGDGEVTTSTGPDDVLPFGDDDCVLWSQTFPMEVRGVAAQDIPAVTTIEEVLDGPPKITTTPEEHYVWIGASTVGIGDPSVDPLATPWPMAYKLDGDTGEILLSTKMPRGAYGFALDGRGILWLTGGAYWGGSIGFIDTNQCVDEASCDVEPCHVVCSTTSCPTTCDGAVKGDIQLPSSDAYGITVDCMQRVWLGGTITRYDPQAPANTRLVVAQPDPLTGLSVYCAGIAADANGWVWGANNPVVRIDAETLTQIAQVPISTYAHGVAVDIDGQVWAISMEQSVHVIEPGATVNDNTVTNDVVTGLDQPYTYSDMTGVQQRLAADAEPGTYRQVLEGCADGEMTTWEDFEFEAETPGESRIVFQVRTADTLEGLEDVDFRPLGIASAIQTSNMAALDAALLLSGEPIGRYVEVEAQLYLDGGAEGRCSSTPAVTPRLLGFSASYKCPPPEPGGPT